MAKATSETVRFPKLLTLLFSSRYLHSFPIPPPLCKPQRPLWFLQFTCISGSDLPDGQAIKEYTVLLLKRNNGPSSSKETKLSLALIFTKEFLAPDSIQKELNDLMCSTSKTSPTVIVFIKPLCIISLDVSQGNSIKMHDNSAGD